MPIDETEKQVASMIDPDEMEANESAYAHNADKCHFCGCELAQRGLSIDGRLRNDLMWGNMRGACFNSKGTGIGWGDGQLYARQPNGDWCPVSSTSAPRVSSSRATELEEDIRSVLVK